LSKFIKVEEILGKLEVQELLGVSDSMIDYLAYRDKGFPKPFLLLKGGRLWEKAVIQAWADKQNRQLKLIEVEPPNPPAPDKPKLPSAKPVAMTDDERAALVAKIFS
jgi:predicted DNA-binding transcriptional regulator AlpA